MEVIVTYIDRIKLCKGKKILSDIDGYRIHDIDDSFVIFISKKNKERYSFQKSDIIMIEESNVDFE